MNTKPIHGEPRPLHEIYGLESSAPVPCDIKIGDIVKYTNDYGVTFPEETVIGFSKKTQSWGGFIHLSKDAWWYPVSRKSLTMV